MGREKRKVLATGQGAAKERHKRSTRPQYGPDARVVETLVGRLSPPKTSSKHHSYFEFVENKDKKKKKLEYKVTNNKEPPPGFAFVPVGNPKLTAACKELSRERDAMIFIVSDGTRYDPTHLSHHIHRTGHHIREVIVEEAKSTLTDLPVNMTGSSDGKPEPLPESQGDYSTQVNQVILDLFPRIPHIDRQAIIKHSFNLSHRNHAPRPVGLVEHLPLTRRVQLAVLAHIRHTHTRYDDLLKKASWENCRKAVEDVCLDVLVKWRGDEETGRDQLDEILREVVIISDSDSEDSDSEEAERAEESAASSSRGNLTQRPSNHTSSSHPSRAHLPRNENSKQGENLSGPGQTRIASKKEQRGFKRYSAWQDAIQRNQGDLDTNHMDVDGPSEPGTGRRLGSQTAPQGQTSMGGTAGSVPNPNGFVPPTRPRTFSPVSIPRSSAMALSGQATPTNDNQASRAPLMQHASPSTHRLQDMLVRSIEPTSPETQRYSPYTRPRPAIAESSPGRHGMQHQPERALPVHDLRTWNTPFYTERTVTSERLPQHMVPSGSHHGVSRSLDHNSGYRNTVLYNDIERRRLQSPPSFLDSRAPALAHAPGRTIVVDAPRPGERSNPIFMEDRGGFFERVHVASDSPKPYAAEGQPRIAHGSSHNLPRLIETTTEPRWVERPQFTRQRREDMDLDTIPTSRAQVFPTESRLNLPGTDSYGAQQPPHARSQGVTHGYSGGLVQSSSTYQTSATAFDHAATSTRQARPVFAVDVDQPYRQPVYRLYEERPRADQRPVDPHLGPQGRRSQIIILD